MKKIISTLLVLVMLMAIAPAASLAEEQVVKMANALVGESYMEWVTDVSEKNKTDQCELVKGALPDGLSVVSGSEDGMGK